MVTLLNTAPKVHQPSRSPQDSQLKPCSARSGKAAPPYLSHDFPENSQHLKDEVRPPTAYPGNCAAGHGNAKITLTYSATGGKTFPYHSSQ